MSFISTYTSLSARGYQSNNDGLTLYTYLDEEAGTTSASIGYYVGISDYTSGNANTYNLTVTSGQGVLPYKLFTTEWDGKKQTFTGASNVSGIQFGEYCVISSDGNYIAAGNNYTTGSFDIYEANGTYSFSLQNTFTPTSNGSYASGQRTINSDGTKIAQQDAGNNTVDIFDRSGNTWTLTTTLSPTNGNIPSTGFGRSASYSNNNTLVLGADGDPATVGTVFIFQNNVQTSRLFPSTSALDDNFGTSCQISADANYIVVGASNSSSTGRAFVFSNTANVWTQLAILTPNSTTVTNTDFGESVAISGNGNIIIVGSPYATHVSTTKEVGAVYVFLRNGNTVTQFQEILTPSANYDANIAFADKIALTSDASKLVISDAEMSGNGRIYLYGSLF